MDLENELRQAMAEHVADMSASETLAAEARRGYRRSARVRALAVTAVAAAVVVIAAMPAYQAFRPEQVGAPGRASSGKPAGAPAPAERKPARITPTATPTARVTPPAARPDAAPSPPAPGSRSGGGAGGHSLLTYLPSGLRQVDPCVTTKAPDRETTSCRWHGSAGLIEVRLVRGATFADPSDVGSVPPVPMPTRVHDQPAIRGDWPHVGSQVSWIERPGLGVWVGVSSTLNDRLMRIAEGVRVTS